MVNNILIFRTDRIGDLLFTCPAIISIKKHLKDTKITLIASDKNYHYAKSLKIFDDILIFPQSSLLKKIKLIHKLSKTYFNYVIAFDGKERSIISSVFSKSDCKIAVIPESKFTFFWNFFKIKFIKDNEKSSIIEIYQKVLDSCKINTSINNFNFLNKKKDNNFSSKILAQNYIHIHLDEKWINNLYIKSYNDINITYDNFIEFIKNISKDNKVLITSGMIDFNLLDNLKKNFTRQDDKIYYKNISNNAVYFIYKPTFEDIESLLRKAKFLVSCHGAVTHAANSLGIKILDILEENKSAWYQRFNLYLKNYKSIFRSDFNLLSKEIAKYL